MQGTECEPTPTIKNCDVSKVKNEEVTETPKSTHKRKLTEDVDTMEVKKRVLEKITQADYIENGLQQEIEKLKQKLQHNTATQDLLAVQAAYSVLYHQLVPLQPLIPTSANSQKSIPLPRSPLVGGFSPGRNSNLLFNLNLVKSGSNGQVSVTTKDEIKDSYKTQTGLPDLK